MAPVETSIQLAGLPDVNVFPVAYPHFIKSVIEFMDHPDAVHPYGLFETYGPKLSWDPERRHLNCFAIADIAHRIMSKGEFSMPTEPILPNICERYQNMVCSNFRAGCHQIPVRGVKYYVDDVAKLDPKIGVQMAAYVGTKWGYDAPWDVESSFHVTPSPVAYKEEKGSRRLNLPKNTVAIKFVTPTVEKIVDGNKVDPQKRTNAEFTERVILRGLFLNGRPVESGKVYDARQAAHMRYIGDHIMNIRYLYSTTRSKHSRL